MASVPSPLKVLFISPEVYPYAAIGGLGRVVYFLPKALLRQGVDVRVIVPKYGIIDLEKYPINETVCKGLKVPTGDENVPFLVCNVKTHHLPGGPQVYFLENMEYFEKRANVYAYADDPIRWALLQRGALEFLKNCPEWIPDVIHCNDWQTGLLPQWLKTDYTETDLANLTSVFTIHNLMFQANFDHKFVSELDYDDGRSQIPGFFAERMVKLNSMRRAILYSDLITTVSENYSREILTADYGEGLDQLLQEVRTKLLGITNGLDYEEFNPATDKNIRFNYDAESTEKRSQNKLELQAEFHLERNLKIPLLGVSYRLTEQKGIDLMMPIMDYLLGDMRVQLVVNGDGDAKFKSYFAEMFNRYPKQVGLNLRFDPLLPRHIFSGADVMLFPSKFEPCGIVQMESMRYGCIPVARAIGGFVDTVEDEVTGFLFRKYDSMAFFATIMRALEALRYPVVWRKLVKNAMKRDFSWDRSAEQYVGAYKRAIELKNQKQTSDFYLLQEST
jgi:starch synthase